MTIIEPESLMVFIYIKLNYKLEIRFKFCVMHIAIAGNIGAGKTTLTKLLSKKYKFEGHYEDVLKNPYLDDFYEEMERWSFNLQIYFLNSRFRQILDFNKEGKNIVQDRTIYEDAFIFAPNLKAMGLMTHRDLSLIHICRCRRRLRCRSRWSPYH